MFLSRCHYQNKKALFTDPIFREGFARDYGILIIILLTKAQDRRNKESAIAHQTFDSPNFSNLPPALVPKKRVGKLSRLSVGMLCTTEVCQLCISTFFPQNNSFVLLRYTKK